MWSYQKVPSSVPPRLWFPEVHSLIMLKSWCEPNKNVIMHFCISFNSVLRKQMSTKLNLKCHKKKQARYYKLKFFVSSSTIQTWWVQYPFTLLCFWKIEHNVALMEEDNIHNHQTEDWVYTKTFYRECLNFYFRSKVWQIISPASIV